MRVSGGDAALPQSAQDGGGVDVQVFADPRQRPACLVAADRVVDILGDRPRRRICTPCLPRMALTVRRSMPN